MRQSLNAISCIVIIIVFLSACSNTENPTVIQENTANATSPDSKEVVVRNFKGVPVTLREVPKRPVVIFSALVSVLDELGVEVTAANTLIDSVKASLKNNERIADIGSVVDPDFKLLKLLNPDIAMMGSAFGKTSTDIENAGIPLWTVNTQTYEQMIDVINMFGNVFDKRNEADTLLNNVEARKNNILSQIVNQEKPSVLVLWGTEDELLVARDQSFVCDILKI